MGLIGMHLQTHGRPAVIPGSDHSWSPPMPDVRAARQISSRAILLLAIALISANVASTASAQTADPIGPRTLDRLLHDAAAPDEARRSEAIAELARLTEGGGLRGVSLRRVVDEALNVQADLERPWDPRWGRIIETAWDAGELNDADIHRYARNATELKLLARPVVRRGDLLPACFLSAGRVSDQLRLKLWVRVRAVRLAGRELPADSFVNQLKIPVRYEGRTRWETLLKTSPNIEAMRLAPISDVFGFKASADDRPVACDTAAHSLVLRADLFITTTDSNAQGHGLRPDADARDPEAWSDEYLAASPAHDSLDQGVADPAAAEPVLAPGEPSSRPRSPSRRRTASRWN
jgi:hypothetical protein